MADTLLQDFTETTAPSDGDLLYTVVDPSGTPADRKITWTNVKAFLKNYLDTIYQASLGYTPENVVNKVTSISSSSTDTQYPSAKLVYDQLSGKQATGSYEVTTNKENTTLDTSTTKYPTNRLVKEYADGKVEDSITDGHTTIAPSGNAVFDALAGKASLTGTETLTNKRINPRLVTAASYTTDTGTSLDVSTCDQFEITAQAGALKFNNPSGTPVGGQKLIIRITDNGTARALTYDTQFRAMGNTLPSTTVVSKTLYMGFIWNATDSKFDLVAVAQES